jgi:cyclopropane fatty-acyl-phospholipid synthase-like methyltransferase
MSSCQSCGALDPEWQPLYHDLALFSCPACQSFSFFSEAPFDAAAVYSRRYFEGGEYADYVGHRRAHEVNFREKWAILARHLRGPTRLLEVGCAYGLFIGFAQDQGVLEVLGIDVSADAIDFATRTFGPHFAVSVDGTHPAFAYNCLVAWDVWEHLPRPLAYFTRLVADLDPGGLFAVATVDSSSWVARHRGRRWRQIHPPTHVHHPTFSAMRRAMRCLGLETLYHGHVRQHRALETYLAPLGLGRLVRRFATLRTLPVPFDLGDYQLIVARKPRASS